MSTFGTKLEQVFAAAAFAEEGEAETAVRLAQDAMGDSCGTIPCSRGSRGVSLTPAESES
jgi:hypothetical protein